MHTQRRPRLMSGWAEAETSVQPTRSLTGLKVGVPQPLCSSPMVPPYLPAWVYFPSNDETMDPGPHPEATWGERSFEVATEEL